jgi:hypothetical protein
MRCHLDAIFRIALTNIIGCCPQFLEKTPATGISPIVALRTGFFELEHGGLIATRWIIGKTCPSTLMAGKYSLPGDLFHASQHLRAGPGGGMSNRPLTYAVCIEGRSGAATQRRAPATYFSPQCQRYLCALLFQVLDETERACALLKLRR